MTGAGLCLGPRALCDFEKVLLAAVPNRWNDITEVLQQADASTVPAR